MVRSSEGVTAHFKFGYEVISFSKFEIEFHKVSVDEDIKLVQIDLSAPEEIYNFLEKSEEKDFNFIF